MRIGVQTFTIRKFQKKNIEEAYLPLIKMGIKDFEVARIDFNIENAQLIKELVDKYSINIVSIQVKPKLVKEEINDLVYFCKTVGCKNIVISMLPFKCILGKEEIFYEFINSLDELYDIYQEEGITLAYHHHNWEYVKVSNGNTRMHELLANTNKIKFIHDTYWTTKCGISPIKQIKEFNNRLLGIHLRDLTLYKKGISVLSKDTFIGDGVIDFKMVIDEALKTNCEYFVIEQKTDNPYECLEKSYKYFKNIGLEIED